MDKYQRDTVNYGNDNVYPWLQGKQCSRVTHQQKASSSVSSGDLSSDTDSSTAAHFLQPGLGLTARSAPVAEHESTKCEGGKNTQAAGGTRQIQCHKHPF